MLALNYIEKLFALEDDSVKDLKVFEDCYFIHMRFKRKPHVCPNCKPFTDKVKNYRPQKIVLDAVNGKTTYAMINKRRYICPHCGKTFYEAQSIVSTYQRRSPSQLFHIIQKFSKSSLLQILPAGIVYQLPPSFVTFLK